jgi:hypothetical protein
VSSVPIVVEKTWHAKTQRTQRKIFQTTVFYVPIVVVKHVPIEVSKKIKRKI